MKKVSSFVCAIALSLGVFFTSATPVMAITQEEVLNAQQNTRAANEALAQSVASIQTLVLTVLPVIFIIGVITFAGNCFKSVADASAAKSKASAERHRVQAESARVEIEEIRKATAEFEVARARLEAERNRSGYNGQRKSKRNKKYASSTAISYYDDSEESSSQSSSVSSDSSESLARARFVNSQFVPSSPSPVDYDGDGITDYVV